MCFRVKTNSAVCLEDVQCPEMRTVFLITASEQFTKMTSHIFSLSFLEPQWPPHRTTTHTFLNTSSLVSMNERVWGYKWVRQHYFIVHADRKHDVALQSLMTLHFFPSLFVTPALLVNEFLYMHLCCVTHYHYISMWHVTHSFCSLLRGYGGREVMFASPVYRKKM